LKNINVIRGKSFAYRAHIRGLYIRVLGRLTLKIFLLVVSLCVLTTATTLYAQQAAVAPKRLSDDLNQELPRWWRLEGEYRVRFEGLEGSGFKTDSSDAYVLGRARVNTTLIPAAWLKFQFQGQDAQVWGRNVKPDAPPYEDTFDVRQAYV